MRVSSFWINVVLLPAAMAKMRQSFWLDEVIKVVDLTVPVLRERFRVRATNIGSEPESVIYVPLFTRDVPNLSVLEAEDERGNSYSILPSPFEEDGVTYFEVGIPTVQPGESVTFFYAQILTHRIEPYPFSAKQADKQLLLYNSSRIALTAYPCKHQTLKLKVPTQNIRDLVNNEKLGKQGENYRVDYIVLGPHNDTKPLEQIPMHLQYENPSPLARVLNLKRRIWVSHFGDAISFEDSYDIVNDGTRLSEPFSRLDYMGSRNEYNLNEAAVKLLRMDLPPNSRDAYYVDLVGNVSTSRFISRKSDTSLLDIVLRFPVMGGWHYNFTIGWTNPLGEFVRSLGNNLYLASIPFVQGPSEVAFDEVVSQIILPEGATDVKLFGPLESSADLSRVFSYLDLYGRPALEIAQKNLISDHRQGRYMIRYKYTAKSALLKPLSYAAGLFAAFVGVFLIRGIDYSL